MLQGVSGVAWWTWLVLGLVLALILLVVGRMLFASWRGNEELESKRKRREESRQRKIEKELKRREERNEKRRLDYQEEGLPDGCHVQCLSFKPERRLSMVEEESVQNQVARPSNFFLQPLDYEQQTPLPYAKNRSSIYV